MPFFCRSSLPLKSQKGVDTIEKLIPERPIQLAILPLDISLRFVGRRLNGDRGQATMKLRVASRLVNVELDLPENATVGDLKKEIYKRCTLA